MKIKQRVGALLVATLLGLGLAVSLATPAAATDYGPFKLVNMVSNLCLEVPNGSMVKGEQLKIGVCGPAGTWYQTFYFTDACCAWHYFIRPGHNWWCLAPGSAGLFNSTIIQWDCNWGDGNEVFFLQTPEGTGPNDPRVLTTARGYYLQPESASTDAYVRQGAPSPPNTPHYEYWKMIHL